MKRVSCCLLAGMLCLLFSTCTKQYSPRPDPDSRLISNAKSYFTSQVAPAGPVNLDNYRALQPKTLQWDQAYVVSLSIGKGVVVPVQYRNTLLVKTGFGGTHSYNLSGFTRLLVYMGGQQQYHAQLVTSLPDSLCLQHTGNVFTGTILVEGWQGDHIADYLFQQGKVPLKYTFGPPSRTAAASVVVSCNNVINGYNYPEDDPDAGYSWSEPAPCTSMYLPDDQVSGDPVAGDYAAGSSGGSNGAGNEDVIIFPGSNLITNIQEYLQCFTVTPGATYKVTVAVDQPYPGTRTPWRLSPTMSTSSSAGPIDAGHTFLIFTQTNKDGSIITRNVGFSPTSDVDAFISGQSQGALDNDESHSYDISGSFILTIPQLFFNMLSYVSQGDSPSYMYNLSSNNCTTFSINVLAQGHIYVPSTIGYWPNGIGNDPGDLGEDLRTNNTPGMNRSLVNVAHPNVGTCN